MRFALQEVDTPQGRLTIPVLPNDVIVQTMQRGEVYDADVVEQARKYIRKGTTVIDIGACFGQMSLCFAEMIGKSGTLIVVEPQEDCLESLSRNLRLAKCKEKVLCHFPAWDKMNVPLVVPKPDFKEFSSLGSYGVETRTEKFTLLPEYLQSITVDWLVAAQPKGVGLISFLKVDAQGSDLHVLRGARKTLGIHRCPFVFEYEEQFQSRFGTCFKDYMDFVDELDYKVDKVVGDINFFCIPKQED